MGEEPEPHRKIDMGIINGTRVIFFCNANEIKNEIQDPSRNPKIIAIDNIGSNTRDTIRQEIEQLFEDAQKKSPLYIEYPNRLPTTEKNEGIPEIWLVAACGKMKEMENWISEALRETS